MRRLLALGMVVPLLGPAAGPFASGGRAHACTDHVCSCKAAARPRQAAGGSCHGSEAARTLTFQATCDHREETVSAGTFRPALLPPSPVLTQQVWAPLPPAPAFDPRTLAPPPDTPPPRPLAS